MASPTLKQLKEAALEHNSKTAFKEAHPKFYKFAWRRGLLDEICGHMQDRRVKWTRSRLQEEANKYRKKSEFQLKSPKAYYAARSKGLLEEITEHMKPTYDTLYLLRVPGTNIFKPGVTSSHLDLARIASLQKGIIEPLELVLFARLNDQAPMVERRLVILGRRAKVTGSDSHEFREYTKEDWATAVEYFVEGLKRAHSTVEPEPRMNPKKERATTPASSRDP